MFDTTINFQSYDGLQLEGTLTAIEKPKATILLVHGILSDRDELGFYSELASFLAERGIASLRFDYRSHGVDKTPITEMNLTGIVNDIEAAFSKLEALTPGVKSQNRYLMGTSFGGGVSAFWTKQNSHRIKRLFLSAPVISYADDVLKSAGNWIPQLRKEGTVNYADHPIGRPLISDMPYINGIEFLSEPLVPVLIFHGDNDDDVPITSSEQYCKPNGKCELFVIKGGGHGFGVPDDEDLTFPETKANHQKVYLEIHKRLKEDHSE